jgi:hypothetical protein
MTLPTVLLITILLAVPLLAQEMAVYTNKADFVERVSAGYYFNDFQSFPSGDQSSTNLALLGGTPVFSFTISTTGILNNLYVVGGTLPSGRAMSTTVESRELLLTFTSGNVTAVGANFFLSDLAENQVDGLLAVTLSDGTSVSFSSSSNGAVEFRGFTTDSGNPISSLRLHADSQYATVDNLHVGAVEATNAVPVALSIRPVNATQIEVSWPSSAIGYVLRAKLNLSSGSWMDAVEADAPSNGFHHVMVSISGEMRFFQLQKP